MEEIMGKEGKFNQAIALQERLHVLFSEYNLRYIHLFKADAETRAWNYDLCLNILTAIYGSVSSFFSEEEKKHVEELRKETRMICRTSKPISIRTDAYDVRRIHHNLSDQDKIADKLLELNSAITSCMDKHGLGNPTKSDPTKSAIKL